MSVHTPPATRQWLHSQPLVRLFQIMVVAVTLTGLALTDEQPGVLLQDAGAQADDGASIPE